MSATGIGAAVRRKEDFRFITGQGQYTDDVVRPGETRAAFVRSPHARAKIKSIDVSAAKKMPGVVDVLTGGDLANDKIGNLICGWMIHSKDGTPMKMAPHPALAAGTVNHVGDAVAVVIGETLAQARDAAEKVKVDYEVLPSVTDPAKAKSGPQIHDVAPKNTIYEWSLGDAKATEAAFAAARHVTKLDIVNNRLVPNAIEPRAALAEYDAGTDNLTLWNTSQNPHVARPDALWWDPRSVPSRPPAKRTVRRATSPGAWRGLRRNTYRQRSGTEQRADRLRLERRAARIP